MKDSVTLLGTGTCELRTDRFATSALLSLEGLYILHDCGRGVCHRLTELGVKQNELSHIVLSHFHPDHVSDLITFFHAAAWSRVDPRKKDLHIYGPFGTQVQVMRILSLFDAGSLQRDHYQIHIHELPAGTFEIEGKNFELVDLPPCGNHGLKFEMNGKQFVLTGDSSFHQQEIDCLRGVDTAVIDSGHIEDHEIIELAVQCQMKRLICSHVYRELDAEKLALLASEKGFRGTLEVAVDRLSLT